MELGPWLALAKGTPGSWPTEGVGLVRGSPQIPLQVLGTSRSRLCEKCPQKVPEWEEWRSSNIPQKPESSKHLLCIGSCMGAQEGPVKAGFPSAQSAYRRLRVLTVPPLHQLVPKLGFCS